MTELVIAFCYIANTECWRSGALKRKDYLKMKTSDEFISYIQEEYSIKRNEAIEAIDKSFNRKWFKRQYEYLFIGPIDLFFEKVIQLNWKDNDIETAYVGILKLLYYRAMVFLEMVETTERADNEDTIITDVFTPFTSSQRVEIITACLLIASDCIDLKCNALLSGLSEKSDMELKISESDIDIEKKAITSRSTRLWTGKGEDVHIVDFYEAEVILIETIIGPQTEFNDFCERGSR